MCKPIADGGQRCAAHTRPGYQAFMEAIDGAGDGFGSADKRKRIRQSFRHHDDNALNTVAEYAATPTGAKEVAAAKERFAGDAHMAAFLGTCIAKGKARAEAAKESATVIRKERQRAEGKARNWSSELRAVEDLPHEQSVLGDVPAINDIWRPEDNNGIRPQEVRRQANAELTWRCKPAGHLNTGRVNNIVNVMRRGGMPICDECQPARNRQLKAAQEDLGALVEMMGNDPDAFNALSAATQYEVLRSLGLLGAGRDTMQRDLALNMIHGDLTLKEVMAAENVERLGRKMRDLTDDEDDLGAVDAIETAEAKVKDQTTRQRVRQVLASSGALGMVPDDSPLAEHIMRENVEALWEQAYANETDLDTVLAEVNAARGRSAGADLVADRFSAELQRVRDYNLPDGYRTERTLPDGTVQVLDPTLSQRRFAALVEDRRRVMNWSGTGAGKTLAATVAVQGVGAKETLVVCPNAVISQWETAFKTGFPDNTEVRVGLPTGDEPPPRPGVNRVWVANYEKFQTDPERTAAQVEALTGRLDAVVYDEIHMAKVSAPGTASRRRNVLENLTDTAAANNPDLVVIGASATPVVNNLDEAASVLRLVEGPESKTFPTAPNLKNAVTAHHRIAAAGIRHMPTYTTALNRDDVTVDVSSALGRINDRVKTMQASSDTARGVHPAMMERALLPEKMPAIVAAVKGRTGPTVVYTEYTQGMVAPIQAALSKEGLRVAQYTGDQTEPERRQVLADFRQGKYDVLIGSKPIATGVDGLQDVCSNVVVASMPWTASADDQLVGRFQRRGQSRDVKVTYVLTEATIGKARWSWCKDNRQKRVRFKRSLADAAVDGIMPDGVLDQKNAGADASLAALQRLAA